LAWIEQAKQGNVLFSALYSTELQSKIFFHPIFFVAGTIGRLGNIPNALLYHSFRVLSALALLVAGYIFIAHVSNSRRVRLLLFLLFATASGLGWIFGYPSVDIIQSESTNFLTAYESVLNSSTIAVFLLIFLVFLNFKKESSIIPALLLSGLLLNGIVLLHGYDVVSVLLILGIFSVYIWVTEKNSKIIKLYLYSLLFTFPSILFQAYVLNTNPILGVWATIQTRVPAQSVLSYIATYGFLSLFGVIGVVVNFKKNNKATILLLAWLVVMVILLFNPVTDRFQQKLAAGIFIPLVLLAGMGMKWWVGELHEQKLSFAKYVLPALILLCSITNIKVVYTDLKYFAQKDSSLYIAEGKQQAMVWLGQQSRAQGSAVAGFQLGNLIPGFSGQVVYAGHYDQTINFEEKFELVQLILSKDINYRDPLRFFVLQNGIRYIVIDDEVRSWGGFDASGRDYLELAYANEDVQIYKVK
jgi:hypothetical protein